MALIISQLVVQLIGRLVLEINSRCNGCLLCFLISYIFAVFYGELRPCGDIAEDKYVEQYVERLCSPILFMCLVWVMNTFMDVLDTLRVSYTTTWTWRGLAARCIRNVFLFISKPLHSILFRKAAKRQRTKRRMNSTCCPGVRARAKVCSRWKTPVRLEATRWQKRHRSCVIFTTLKAFMGTVLIVVSFSPVLLLLSLLRSVMFVTYRIWLMFQTVNVSPAHVVWTMYDVCVLGVAVNVEIMRVSLLVLGVLLDLVANSCAASQVGGKIWLFVCGAAVGGVITTSLLIWRSCFVAVHLAIYAFVIYWYVAIF